MPLPPPLKPLRCNNADCTFAEGGRCARLAEFPDPANDCVDLARAEEATAPVSTEAAPWSGRHLPPAEADRLLWRSPARLIAVLGPFNAGKTCLLTSFFLQLANGQRGSFPYRFASSLTLHGFRELAEHASRWSGKKSEDIVLHTSKEDSELLGYFLHLGLRPERDTDNRHLDVLLSDVSGEWVKHWTGKVDVEANRRMRFISRSDAFFVLADAEALLEPEGGKVDHETSLLIRRVVTSMKEAKPRPPIAVVFSKFDRVAQEVPPPPESQRSDESAWGQIAKRARRTWLALKEAQSARFPVGLFPVSAFPSRLADGQPAGVMAPFTWVMQYADRREPWPREPVPIPEDAQGFATMRRWKDEP
jgi:hypothetical protein